LRGVGDERDALPEQCRLRELRCLRTPTPNGVAGFLGLRWVDAQEADAAPTQRRPAVCAGRGSATDATHGSVAEEDLMLPVIYSMSVSLDGFIAGPAGRTGWGGRG